jgi:hypothetical protein
MLRSQADIPRALRAIQKSLQLEPAHPQATSILRELQKQ